MACAAWAPLRFPDVCEIEWLIVMEKLEPLAHIFVFPLSQIDMPAGAGTAFTIADVFRGLLLPMGGESGESNENANDNYQALEWQKQPAFEKVENLAYVRFMN